MRPLSLDRPLWRGDYRGRNATAPVPEPHLLEDAMSKRRVTDPDRRKAVALLQALLTEAVTKPPHQPSVSDKKEIGNE